VLSDSSGAIVAGAKITITSLATGQAVETATNSSGSFHSGPLLPGNYKVLISAKTFTSAETAVSVQVGNTATVNVSLKVGNEKEIIEVQGSALRVNTEQAIVQGVLNEQQIETSAKTDFLPFLLVVASGVPRA
jgi:spore coat protein U-like protein